MYSNLAVHMEGPVNVRHVARILRRIRQIIADAVRSYECSKNIMYSSLHVAKTNLRRISTEISRETYNKLLEAINALILIQSESRQQRSYVAPRINLNSQYFSLLLFCIYHY